MKPLKWKLDGIGGKGSISLSHHMPPCTTTRTERSLNRPELIHAQLEVSKIQT